MTDVSTLICLTKNLVYKNIEAQMWKKIRIIIRISPAREDCKNILLLLLKVDIGTAVNKKNFDCFVIVFDINQSHI